MVSKMAKVCLDSVFGLYGFLRNHACKHTTLMLFHQLLFYLQKRPILFIPCGISICIKIGGDLPCLGSSRILQKIMYNLQNFNAFFHIVS
mmetsp:Transcript_17858/g.20200  ORF Transcript_17858/g.20200 Transcript_17858/m.20200 type:complete len:90 (-) Transcript_17858:595-864(-)